MKDITLGQFYPVNSCIHRLDPRTKIICTMLLIIAVFVGKTFICLGACAAFILTVSLLAKIPFLKLIKGLKPVVALVIITFILNIFFYSKGDVLISFWIIKITSGGLERALFMALRLILLVLSASLMTFTTSPIRLTDGIESLLKPLTFVGFPAHEIAMMMSIALRFIPILSQEADKIMKAQSARGACFDSGSLIKRARNMVALLIPLLVSSFMRADELAMAMEARCYHGGKGRTKYKELHYAACDAVAIIAASVFLLLCIADNMFF